MAERIDRLIDARWPALQRTFVQARAQQCGVTNGYANPAQLGADRWCGLIGAHAAYPGEHVLIATFGTATTLEALHADGTFTGGLIAPGWLLMMQSLGNNTAQLPTLSSDTARNALTGNLFATGTREGLSAGCLLAQAGFYRTRVARSARPMARRGTAGRQRRRGGRGSRYIKGAAYLPRLARDPGTRADRTRHFRALTLRERPTCCAG